jgi:hypothetical protein
MIERHKLMEEDFSGSFFIHTNNNNNNSKKSSFLQERHPIDINIILAFRVRALKRHETLSVKTLLTFFAFSLFLNPFIPPLSSFHHE